MSAPVVHVPGSKSVTHRAYILAASSDAPCVVSNPLRGADTDATMAALHALGARVEPDERAVRFDPAPAVAPHEPINCHNAGTALRLLMAHAARQSFPVAFTGDASLSTRPNAPLIAALRSLGVRVSGDDTLPLTVQGPLQSGIVSLPARCSSQYASALLLALAQVDGTSRLQLESPVASRPYIDLTVEVAQSFGLTLHERPDGFDIPGAQVPRATTYHVEGDWSSVAFPAVAAAITSREVRIRGLRTDSTQGDRALLDHLQAFGCRVRTDNDITVEGQALESPGTIDVQSTPDLFPALGVLAACARGTTTFVGGAALRDKESNRIAAMVSGLQALGVDAQETPDGMTVQGGQLTGGTVHAHDDHRIHMAFRVAALAAKGKVHVDGHESVAVSYPAFDADLAAIQEVP